MAKPDAAEGTPAPPQHRHRALARRIWRARASRLLTLWLVIAAVEWTAWRYFLQSAFFRDFFMPIAVLVLILGVAASWRMVRRRERDRRGGDRRREQRRDESVSLH